MRYLRNYVPILVAFLAVEVGILVQFGIRTSTDSNIYLQLAQDLSDFKFPEQHYTWYLSYIALLAICKSNLVLIVSIQILFSFIATIAFFEIISKLSGNHFTAMLASIFLIFWVEIKSFDVYIYTESLFTNLLILSTWALLFEKKWLSVFLIFLTTFTRPQGVLFLISVIVFLIFKNKKWMSKPAIYALIFSFVVLTFVVLNFQLSTFTLIDSYCKAEIVFPNIKLWLEIPQNLFIPPNKNRLWNVVQFAWYNPVYFVRLCSVKVFVFFSHIKPWYSSIHNVFIITTLLPIYIGFMYSFSNKNIKNEIKLFFGTFLLLNVFCAALTSESWDGRFLIPVLPIVIIFSALSFDKINIFKSNQFLFLK